MSTSPSSDSASSLDHECRGDAANPRLRVLHVTEALGGGVTTALQAYVRLTPDFEHIILGNRRSPYYEANWMDEKLRFVDLPSEGKLQQLRAVAREVRRLNPDVIHAHSSWAGVFVRLPTVASRTRIVYTPHCFAFERTDVRRVLRMAFRFVEAVLGLRTGHLLANGQREVDLAKGLRTLRRTSRFLVTPWQPSDDLRSPVQRLSEDHVVRVTTCGRVVPQKGVDFFLSVVRVWRATAGDDVDAIRWTWVGGGPAQDESKLRDNGVEVTGWLPQGAVLERLKESDVYLHTAEWEAGYPLAVMEAAGVGLPLVVRCIRSLEDLKLRLVDTPEDAVVQLRELLRPAARVDAAACTRALLDDLLDEADAAHLAEVYREAARGARRRVT